MAYTAFTTGFAQTVVKNVTQTAHGLVVGDIVRYNGTNYVKAQANNFTNSQAIGIVTNVADANNFSITVCGYVSALSGLTPGSLYYLSEATAGLLTLTAPSTLGQVVRPVLIAVSATEAYVMYWTGEEIANSGGFTWNTVAGTSQTLATANGYIPQNVGLTTFSLPATAAVGDTFRIAGRGAGGWTLAQAAGQTVFFGNVNTTTGAGGSLSSSNRGDCIELVCVGTNTDFEVISSIGNITYV